MRYAKSRKAETRARVIETATRALQRDGIDGSGLAGLMGEAGLTKGGFYAHFQSKDDLVAEAVSTSLQASAQRMQAMLRASGDQELDGFRAIVEAYLQPAHAVASEGGCTIGALLSDLTRAEPKVRDAAATGAAGLMSALEDALPERLGAKRRAKSQAIFGMLTGSLQLARLQSDEDAKTQILSAAIDAACELVRSPND